MRSMYHTTMVLGLISLALVGATGRSEAQTVVRFDSTWRYNQGGTNLGTGWRTNGFNDGSWPSGQSLFAAETTAYPEPFRTTLTAPDAGGPITTYYRIHFNFAGTPAGYSLIATNYIDDGMVAYLNNTEIFRFNMPAGVPALGTLASAANAEPQTHITNVLASGLINGDNVLAVEVHQSAANSSDVVFGLSLTLTQPQPLVITSQPQSQTVPLGSPASLSVGVTGSNPRFQWFRNGAAVAGATSNSFNIAVVTTNAAGNFFVVVTNSISSVTSSVAVLTVVSDTFPPKLLSAVVQDTGATNTIIVNFDEAILRASATNLNSYVITRCDGALVTVSNVQALTTNVQVRVGGPNWRIGDDYILTVNGVADMGTNYISPTNNQIAVAFFELLVPYEQNWSFYYDSILNGTYPPPNWPTNNYDESVLGWGGPSLAPFYYGLVPGNCDQNTVLSEGPITYYFRTHFNAPTNSGRADLQLRVLANAGQVYYLNGVEFFRVGMPATPVTPTTPGQAQGLNCAVVPTPRTVTVNNLRSGDNLLAVEVHQPSLGTVSLYYASELKLAIQPGLTRARINYTHVKTNNTLRLSWTGPQVLQTATVLTGPWSVAGSNITSFTNPITGPQKFYRLRGKCN